ncbi:MAG: DNA adenine methylase [Candidatus Sungbacteria bacterium]|uniref:DNA adenine methylase n=1 Tax=Candidatus Sungiibacteriota bacterium TaxID=2750080 RepID=A0A931SDM2_9BACT|nr:DNA adenine methylase [Candidatus Sungbacteria bacterium]
MTVYPEIYLTIKLDVITDNHEYDRNKLRKLAINEFAKEVAGKGKGELSTKYKYVVEDSRSGNRVYITRPAFNKLGFDFLIHVENCTFSNGKDNPKHEDLANDIKNKVLQHKKMSKDILKELEKVYECSEPDAMVDYKRYDNLPGLPMDLVLKTAKWFFIEQDIRYWNYSGRNMLMDGLRKVLT